MSDRTLYTVMTDDSTTHGVIVKEFMNDFTQAEEWVREHPGTWLEAWDSAGTLLRAICQWYALCERPAAGTVSHPALGDVPTCKACAQKHDLELVR